jgi:hypothetical protein
MACLTKCFGSNCQQTQTLEAQCGTQHESLHADFEAVDGVSGKMSIDFEYT